MLSKSALFFSALSLLASTSSASPVKVQKRSTVAKGYAAAAPDSWAGTILQGQVSSYYHWENPKIDAAGDHEFIPMFWSYAKMDQWNAQKAAFNGPPQHILGQNELDVPSQANQNAQDAANDWCAQLRPFQQQGSKVGSATAYDVNILTEMSQAINDKCGGSFDFIAAHWYGSYNDLDGFKGAMTAQHNAFPDKKIWITEFATTASGGGSYEQTKQFMNDAINWADSTGWVERVFYFGGWNTNPDGYANDNNKFFNDDGSLTDLAYSYQYD